MAIKQVVLTGQSGKVRVEELELEPVPAKHVRVKIIHSGISPGTELLGLDRSRGLDGEFRMGYQAAGIVEEVGPGFTRNIKVGDRVACYGGPYVYHASHLNVPENLVALLPDSVDTREAAFCALASIALHGFRHSGCCLGEMVAVVGLGLLGNLAAQCAKAAGCRVIGCELMPRRIAAARDAGLEVVSSLEDLKSRVAELSNGHGADAVLLAVKNTDAFMLTEAYHMVRRLGKVVILGLSDAQLPRELMFSKEASVVVSRAAGWGRYSREYEFEGRDLPYEHARWTEGRNLEEAIRLMGIGALQITPLITDEMPYSECARAYENLVDHPQDHLAVVFRW